MPTATKHRAWALSPAEFEARAALVITHAQSLEAINALISTFNTDRSSANLEAINVAIDHHNLGILAKIQTFAAEIAE